MTEKTRGDLPTDLPRGHEQPRGTSGHTRGKKSSVNKSFGPGSGGGIEHVFDNLLSAFAVTYCNDQDPNRAKANYEEVMRKIKPKAFREELQSFMNEVEAGNEPDCRGAAFMARLMKRRSEVIKQSGGK